jgi:hypothetical protein
MVRHYEHRRWIGIPLLFIVVAGCASRLRMIPLLEPAGAPRLQAAIPALEVSTRSTAVLDPLPVQGSDVAYTGTEAALYHAVVAATAPWAERHAGRGGSDGCQLLVEVTSAEAEYENGRAVFTLGTRATLRERAGNAFLAQTQAACKQGEVVPPEEGGRVVYRCMNEVGRQLENWLDGVDLGAVEPAVTH